MTLIGYPYPDYTIIVIRKETSYIIKDSEVDDTRYSLHMPMGEVTISMFYVISFYILHYVLPKSVLY